MLARGITRKIELDIIVRDREGRLKEVRRYEYAPEELGGDLIVDVGFNEIARRRIGNYPTPPPPINTIAIGSGTTAPTAADTALEYELDRASAAYSEPATKQFREENTITATAAWTVTEAGCFNPTTPGGTDAPNTLLNRATFAAVSLASGDSIITRFTFTLA